MRLDISIKLVFIQYDFRFKEGVQKTFFKKLCLVHNLPICLCAYVGHQIFLIQKHHGS